jgi:hypothetical protein
LDQDRRRKGALKREIKELSGEITSASEIISSQKELINLLRTGEPAHAYEVLHVLKSEPEDRLDSAEGLKTIIERSRSGGTLNPNGRCVYCEDDAHDRSHRS